MASYTGSSFLDFWTVLTGLSIAANVIVSFVILRYRELRKDDSNILLLQKSIMEILFLFSAAVSARSGGEFVSCYSIELTPVPLFCAFLLLIVITIDWYIKTYSENRHPKCHRIGHYIAVASAYGVTIAVGYFVSSYCKYENNVYGVMMYATIGFSLVFLAFMVLVNIAHGIQLMRRRSTERAPDNIGLAIGNIFMLACLTVYPPLAVAIWADQPDVFQALLTVALCTCLAIPIFSLIYLYRCKKFNVYLKKTFSCQCDDDRNEAMDGAAVAYNDASGVLIDEQTRVP